MKRFLWLVFAFSCSASRTSLAADLDPATRQLSRDIFKQLIEINTTDSVGNNTTAAQAMAKRLLDAGFPAADVVVLGPNERKGNMVARLRGTGAGGHKPILIIGHLDVVEARRSDWTTDPFEFVEKDGYFYGRGTQDMKVSDAIAVTTFIRFKQEGYRPDRDIILALTSDEEGGNFNGVDWLLKNHRDLIDAEFVLNADSGGVYTDHGKPVDVEMEATEKLYADFQVTATNPGGHSSLPTPDNAIYHVADALSRLERSPFPFELNTVTRAWLEQMAKVESPERAADIRAVLKTPPDAGRYRPACPPIRATTPPCTPRAWPPASMPVTPTTRFRRRRRRTSIAASCRVTRRSPFAANSFRSSTIPKSPSATRTSTVSLSTRRPIPSRLRRLRCDRDVLQPLEQIAAEMWPGAPVLPEMETGASDSKYTMEAGIPSYGVNGVAIDRDDIRAHGQDERVRVTSYYDGVEFYYRYLKALTSSHP